MQRSHGTPILVRKDAGGVKLERIRFEESGSGTFDEKWIQSLVHSHPDCLPIDEIEPGFSTPLSVCMEFPTQHGPIDNVLVTLEGDIVLVETKLWKNPEARRKVMAQALDYASCLFDMDYGEFEHAALMGDFGDATKPSRLYDLFEPFDTTDETTFVDAINTNLRRGRILVLIVGDGIRTEAERLAASLQAHAGFHFTLALVELAVYRLQVEGELLVHPRTLTKTTMIERGVVRIEDGKIKIRAQAPVAREDAPTRQESITSEQFFEAMALRDSDLPAKLRNFMGKLERLGVRMDFQRSLNLKWDPPSGKPVNLGYIMRDGQVWTEAVNGVLPHRLSHPYIEELATALDGDVDKETLQDGHWHVRYGSHAPRIEQMSERLDAWCDVIEGFLKQLREHFANEE